MTGYHSDNKQYCPVWCRAVYECYGNIVAQDIQSKSVSYVAKRAGHKVSLVCIQIELHFFVYKLNYT